MATLKSGKLFLPGQSQLSGSALNPEFSTSSENTLYEVGGSADPTLGLLTDMVRRHESEVKAFDSRLKALEKEQGDLIDALSRKANAQDGERQWYAQGARLLKMAFWVQIIPLVTLSLFSAVVVASHWAPGQWSEWLVWVAGFVGIGGFVALSRFLWKLSKIGDRLARLEEKFDARSDESA